MSDDFNKLLQEARASREPGAAYGRKKRIRATPLALVNALLLPVATLVFVPSLAIYFLILAPAFPIIVTVLWLQMRGEWSQPEVAVGLCTLLGFAIGYALLCWQHAPLVVAKIQSLLNAI